MDNFTVKASLAISIIGRIISSSNITYLTINNTRSFTAIFITVLIIAINTSVLAGISVKESRHV